MTKDYINHYGKRTQKFQEGGMAPAPEQMAPEGGAPAGPEGGDQGAEIQAAIQQVIQTQDPELALQVCNALGEMMGISGGGEGAPAEGAPAPGPEGAGAPMPEDTPMARRGIKTRRPVFSASIRG
ncbi:hypothetical protein MHBO_004511 [Bonamia ostreae]|uniref:Uncharacterized protein n=1 Tax=Bonamia ostreae TaxID=126728 RepID=A0ABV2AU37_9EUKA